MNHNDLEKLDKHKELSILAEEEKTFKGVMKWNIRNSDLKSLIGNGKYSKTKSDTFSIGSPYYCSFHFLLYPNGKNPSTENCVCVCLIFNRKHPEGSWIKGKIYLGALVSLKEFSLCGKDANGRIDVDNLCQACILKKTVDLNDVDLVLHCNLKIKVKEIKCTFDKEVTPYVQNRNFDECKESLKRESFTDVTITVDGHTIEVQKSVLGQVHYFQELFDTDESKNHYELTNIRYPTFLHLLDFLYTRDIPELHFKLACELYVIASDLKILDLKNLCGVYLGANLSEVNVFVVVKLSHEFDDTDLKKECIKFVKTSDDEILAENSVVL